MHGSLGLRIAVLGHLTCLIAGFAMFTFGLGWTTTTTTAAAAAAAAAANPANKKHPQKYTEMVSLQIC